LLRRNEIRRRYERNLSTVPGLSFQAIRAGCASTCKDFSILVDSAQFGAPREWLFEALTKENIEVKRYFWPPVHRQKLYRERWDGRPLPATDRISDNVISLPIYSTLAGESIDGVCEAIARAQAFVQKNGIEKRMWA
jgi:dTDP-4-amino-4,6-dideoxygalactose transaminase